MNFEKESKNYIGAILKYSNKMYIESPVCDKEDLIQAGYIGMIKGVKSFSEAKAKKSGTKKTTYVIQCIKNAILHEANKFYGATAIPYNKRLKLNNFQKLITDGETKENIIKKLDISSKEYSEYEKILNTIKNQKSLSSLSEDKEPYKQEETTENIDIKKELVKMGLSKEEIEIISLRLVGQTYTQIATQYNVKRETMRNRILKIINKIKKVLEQ